MWLNMDKLNFEPENGLIMMDILLDKGINCPGQNLPHLPSSVGWLISQILHWCWRRPNIMDLSGGAPKLHSATRWRTNHLWFHLRNLRKWMIVSSWSMWKRRCKWLKGFKLLENEEDMGGEKGLGSQVKTKIGHKLDY